MIEEEPLELGDIQGAVIPGFKKDHQALLALRIVDVAGCKAWLRERAPELARGDEVLAFNRLHKTIRRRRGSERLAPKVVWLSMSFSAGGLALLRPGDDIAAAFDDAFFDGMFQSNLADAPPETWIIGSPDAVPHILLVLAADDPRDLRAEVARMRATIAAAKAGGRRGLRLLTPQFGATLPDPLRGHEHFGFKDGVSQPAVRGLASAEPGDFIDERRLAPSDPNFDRFAAPGRPLIWPGQFVLGYPRQSPFDDAPREPAQLRLSWQRNGSYLVYRRIQQKVHAFWRFCIDQSRRLSLRGGDEISPEKFASLLVGRWPSGAPLIRTPREDHPELAKDADVNNDFFFSGPTPEVLLADGTIAGATLPPAEADPEGTICPFPAHIRKVNPRDDPTETGGLRRTRMRLMLRRGIPYGPAPSVRMPVEDDGIDRGLLFMAYQASIIEQFEFVTKTWANRDNSPHNSIPTTGHDPVIGQSARQRFIRCALDDQPIDLPEPWVVTTGGGYFFTPAVSAIEGVLSDG